jgi:hypothetical protein
MGIQETVLKKHIEAVTKFYNKYKVLVLTESEQIRNEHIECDPAEYRKLRERRANYYMSVGDDAFEKQNLIAARTFYTRSLSSAIAGKLGALAYFKRFAIFNQAIIFKNSLYHSKAIRRGLLLFFNLLFQIRGFV